MDIVGLLITIVIGAIAGYLASLLMGTKGGLIRDIVLGLIGGFVGGFILGIFKISIDLPFYLGNIIVGFLGACVVVFVFNLLFK